MHGSTQLLVWWLPSQSSTQDALSPFRRIDQYPLQPTLKCLICNCSGCLFIEHLEDRVYTGLDGPLAQEVDAEGMNGADAGKLQFFQCLVQATTLQRRRPRPCLLDLKAEAKLHFASCLFRERDGYGVGQCSFPAPDQPDDSTNQDRGLSSPCRSLNEKRHSVFRQDPSSHIGVCEISHFHALNPWSD